MMERIKPRTLSGFMELLPEKQIYFEKMLEKLRESYSLYFFTIKRKLNIVDCLKKILYYLCVTIN